MTPNNVMVFSFCLFFTGLFGVLLRRNLLVLLMCVELMLNAANLALIHYSAQLQDMTGQLSVFFVITVAAAEAAVGLGLLITLFRNLKSVSTDDIRLMKE